MVQICWVEWFTKPFATRTYPIQILPSFCLLFRLMKTYKSSKKVRFDSDYTTISVLAYLAWYIYFGIWGFGVFCHIVWIYNWLVNDLINRPWLGDTTATQYVYYNTITNAYTVAPVLASFHSIWRDICASNTITISDEGDNQTIQWAAIQISDEPNIKLWFHSFNGQRHLHPIPVVIGQHETGWCIKIHNFSDVGAIMIDPGHRSWTLRFRVQKCGPF